MTSLTLFFIVEPPSYQNMACYLAASLRQNMPRDVRLVGYCPAARIEDVSPAVKECLARLDVDLRPFETEGRFDPAYPHGNKMLACLEPRDTEFSGFMDSDILMLNPTDPAVLVRRGHVSASVAASMRWAPDDIWDKLYGAMGWAVPEDRVMLMRDKRRAVPPYFSSGFVLFPEDHRNAAGQNFPQAWMDVAQRIDAVDGIAQTRPYLDQMTLPLAIRHAGLDTHILPEDHHYILGGRLRGKPVPEDMHIHLVHYRKWAVLKEAGLAEAGYKALKRQAGARQIARVMDVPAPAPSQPRAVGKGAVAAVTMVRQDYVFLDIWLRYYSDQIGRENLHVFNHGGDARVADMAKGATVIDVPVADDLSRFDRDRWAMLSAYASDLTARYDWVLCNDVDEIVAVDPDRGMGLADYLRSLSGGEGGAPTALAPFAVEIVHTPASEPGALDAGRGVLAQRRHFRLNSNYAKPCLITAPVRFSVGGHGSDQKQVPLSDVLYLFHLRFMDVGLSRDRLAARAAFSAAKNGPLKESGRKTHPWDNGLQTFENLSAKTPVGEEIAFPDFRESMVAGRVKARNGGWQFKNMRSKDLYRLPDRFSGLF